jgi:pimeloyl-ACP methyl ester carboxylesterase
MRARGLVSRTIDAGGVRVHVYDGKGRGGLPPVVLVHGLGAAGPAFARVVTRLLPQVRRVIVPELPGHGRSVHPAGRQVTPALVLDAMTAALDSVIDEPAIVYGNSLGGAVSIGYALRSPSRTRALMLVSPAGAELPEREWKELVDAFDVTDVAAARRFLERLYHRPPWFLALVAHEFPDVLARRAVRDILATATRDPVAPREDLASLAMPVLLVWGRSEHLLPARALAYFREHLPPHAVIEEPEAFGHSPQLEVPRRVADRVLAFARSLG